MFVYNYHLILDKVDTLIILTISILKYTYLKCIENHLFLLIFNPLAVL